MGDQATRRSRKFKIQNSKFKITNQNLKLLLNQEIDPWEGILPLKIQQEILSYQPMQDVLLIRIGSRILLHRLPQKFTSEEPFQSPRRWPKDSCEVDV